MKTKLFVCLSLVLFLASCAPSLKKDDEILQSEEDSPVETSIVTGYRLAEDNYKTILPYRPSAARGVIVGQVFNRLDIDEMEEGLRRHSIDTFDPEEYYFQEGRYLDSSTVYSLIDELNPQRPKKDEEQWDIEDHEANPRIFSHILEQNYLLPSKEDEQAVYTAGISIAIGLRSVYQFKVKDIEYSYDIPEALILQKGYEVAEEVVRRLRSMEEVPDVPILVALYREESEYSPVPGNYLKKTVVPSGKNSIDDWENIDEEYILFPSNEANNKYLKDSEMVNKFAGDIAEFFPNYVGTIGTGFYVDGELRKLTLEVPMEFNGKAEVIGFTQYVYELVQKNFANHFDLEINVISSSKMESLIFRNAREEQPTIHIFH